MSSRLSPGKWSTRWRIPAWTSHFPSFSAAMRGLKTNAFQTKRPPGASAAATRSKTRRLSLHVGQMQHGAERAVDERRWLVEREVAHVALVQLELDSRLGGLLLRQCEHRRRAVDADDLLAGLLRDRHRNPPVADRELDDGPVGLADELEVERDVLGHVRRPVVVDRCEGRVFVHRGILAIVWSMTRARTFFLSRASASRRGRRASARRILEQGVGALSREGDTVAPVDAEALQREALSAIEAASTAASSTSCASATSAARAT